jgi:hypothetical protein
MEAAIGSGQDAATDAAANGPAADAPADDAPAEASDAGSRADVITFGDPICTPQSGTRIKVRWYQGPEGTSVFDTMYDSMLNAPCTGAPTSDGKLRCLPLGNSEPIYFADSQCTTPIMQKPDYDCAVPAFVGTGSYSYCGSPLAVYQVGAEEADAGTVYQGSATSCSPATYLPPYEYYALTPMPASTFVEGTAGKVTAGAYSMNTIDFSDGARYCDFQDGFFDTALNVLTYPTTATDGTNRLLPVVPPPSGFSDSHCTAPATIPVGECGGTVPVFSSELNQCTFVETVRSIGPAVDGGFELDYALDGSTVCNPAPAAPEGGTWNALSAPLAPSTFDEVLTQAAGTGRLQSLTWATVGGFRWLEGSAFDTQAMAACSVPPNSGATAPCLPTTTFSASILYSDSMCTQPLYLVNMPQSCVPAGFPSATTVARLPTCPPRLVHVGAAYTGVMFQKNGTSCNGVLFPDDAFWLAVDDLGTAYEQMTAVIQ